MKLTDQQINTLIDVFQTETAAGFTSVLMDLYESYLMSSGEYLGEISQDEIKNKFFCVNQISKLLKAIEPDSAFKLKKVS